MCLWGALQGPRAHPSLAHLLQVCKGDRVAGEHLVRLVSQRRQQRELLPVRQVVAEHGQACAVRGEQQTSVPCQHMGTPRGWVLHPQAPGTPRRRKGEQWCCTPSIQLSNTGICQAEAVTSSPPPSAPRAGSTQEPFVLGSAACTAMGLPRAGCTLLSETRQPCYMPRPGQNPWDLPRDTHGCEGTVSTPGEKRRSHLYCLALSMYSCCSMPWESAADTSMMLLQRHKTVAPTGGSLLPVSSLPISEHPLTRADKIQHPPAPQNKHLKAKLAQ